MTNNYIDTGNSLRPIIIAHKMDKTHHLRRQNVLMHGYCQNIVKNYRLQLLEVDHILPDLWPRRKSVTVGILTCFPQLSNRLHEVKLSYALQYEKS